MEERSASLLKVQQELADAENTVGARYEKALDELKQRLEDERRRGQGLEEELRRTRETIAESAFNEREEEIFGLKEEHVWINEYCSLYPYNPSITNKFPLIANRNRVGSESQSWSQNWSLCVWCSTAQCRPSRPLWPAIRVHRQLCLPPARLHPTSSRRQVSQRSATRSSSTWSAYVRSSRAQTWSGPRCSSGSAHSKPRSNRRSQQSTRGEPLRQHSTFSTKRFWPNWTLLKPSATSSKQNSLLYVHRLILDSGPSNRSELVDFFDYNTTALRPFKFYYLYMYSTSIQLGYMQSNLESSTRFKHFRFLPAIRLN